MKIEKTSRKCKVSKYIGNLAIFDEITKNCKIRRKKLFFLNVEIQLVLPVIKTTNLADIQKKHKIANFKRIQKLSIVFIYIQVNIDGRAKVP